MCGLATAAARALIQPWFHGRLNHAVAMNTDIADAAAVRTCCRLPCILPAAIKEGSSKGPFHGQHRVRLTGLPRAWRRQRTGRDPGARTRCSATDSSAAWHISKILPFTNLPSWRPVAGRRLSCMAPPGQRQTGMPWQRAAPQGWAQGLPGAVDRGRLRRSCAFHRDSTSRPAQRRGQTALGASCLQRACSP